MLLEGNTFIFIKPRVKFLAITIDQEHFVSLDQNDVNMCLDARHFKICKNLVIRRVMTTNECEINLLTNSRITEINDFCKIKYKSIDHGIFYKLL